MRTRTIIGLIVLSFILLVSTQIGKTACAAAEVLTSTPTDDLDPRWSPDGKQIAFIGHHEGNPEIYLLDVETRAVRNLSHSRYDDYRPMWSPDGNYLAFFHRGQRGLQLRVAELATGRINDVTSHAAGIYEDTVHWSADSQIVSFGSSAALVRYDLQTHTLDESIQWHIDQFGISRINFSPDGKKVVLRLYDLRPQARNAKLSLVDLETGIETFAVILDVISVVSWSPDSSRFAFTEGYYSDSVILNTYDLPTQTRRQLGSLKFANYQESPIWSPDNRLTWIVPSSTNHFVPEALRIADSAFEQQQISTRFNIDFVLNAWSPTRDHVAFSSYAGVYVLDVPTGNYRDFIQGIGKVFFVSWSADGNYIAASTGGKIAVTDIRDGDLCTYGSTYRAFRYVRRYRNYEAVRGEAQWSPSGDRLVFSSGSGGTGGNTNLVLITLPS